jgi:eukaryotic-like serine/threonine-protein kinase
MPPESWPQVSAGTVPMIDGRYLVEREIARGGMGVVYLAQDIGLGRKVALKLVNPDVAQRPDVVDYFQREASALASVRHENVVQVYAFGTDDPAPGQSDAAMFFAMEYVNGRDLDEIITEHESHGVNIPTYRALTILRQVASGLAAVHSAGIIHRDVKPGNIIIETDSGRPVLVDFGLAMPHDPKLTHAAAGSPSYMAPEQAYGDAVGPAADVYAFGVSAFEILTGRLPFLEDTIEGQLRAHAHDDAPVLSSLRPNLRTFDRVMARMLAKDPRARYDGFASLVAAFDSAIAKWRSGSTEPAPSYPEGGGPGRGEILRILVVDDDDSFRKVAARAAQLAFYRRQVSVSVAKSGADALARAERAVPDLILVDLKVEGLDGVETISRLRAMPRGTETRVLVVTDRHDDAERWRFSILGVNDFFAKQAGLVELVNTITQIGERAAWLGKDDPEPVPSSRSL